METKRRVRLRLARVDQGAPRLHAEARGGPPEEDAHGRRGNPELVANQFVRMPSRGEKDDLPFARREERVRRGGRSVATGQDVTLSVAFEMVKKRQPVFYEHLPVTHGAI